MHIFFSDQVQSNLLTLSAEESRHCIKVLRLREGDPVLLTNGRGTLCTGRLVSEDPRSCNIEIVSREEEYGKRPFSLHMAVAPTKQIDRFEWFLEKATECGIDRITPVICAHSERQVVKPERLEKILLSAMKQSARAYLPVLEPTVPFHTFLEQLNALPENSFIAHCGQGKKHRLDNDFHKMKDTLIMVGPEGDFSKEEVDAALLKGFRAISMGQHRLRTETAAVALCVQVNFMNGVL
ncbi:MAG: 16S rRNA (uracil(1498)-N(3))-methyltransferase [Bacteroidia bacterium]|nr:MAG: 16S rRNA (uracil(1498)-N(3))-methyltransferase [Bacteroidia bacterium]